MVGHPRGVAGSHGAARGDGRKQSTGTPPGGPTSPGRSPASPPDRARTTPPEPDRPRRRGDERHDHHHVSAASAATHAGLFSAHDGDSEHGRRARRRLHRASPRRPWLRWRPPPRPRPPNPAKRWRRTARRPRATSIPPLQPSNQFGFTGAGAMEVSVVWSGNMYLTMEVSCPSGDQQRCGRDVGHGAAAARRQRELPCHGQRAHVGIDIADVHHHHRPGRWGAPPSVGSRGGSSTSPGRPSPPFAFAAAPAVLVVIVGNPLAEGLCTRPAAAAARCVVFLRSRGLGGLGRLLRAAATGGGGD